MSKRKASNEAGTKITKFLKSQDGSDQPQTSKPSKLFNSYDEFMAKIDADRKKVSKCDHTALDIPTISETYTPILQVASSIMEFKFNKQRARVLTDIDEFPEWGTGGVIYWMFRDQRIDGNLKMISRTLRLSNEC